MTTYAIIVTFYVIIVTFILNYDLLCHNFDFPNV